MKTHTLAKALRTLADIMESIPNTELSDFSLPKQNSQRTNDEIAVNLKTLASLSKISKKQWIDFIDDYGFSIDIKPRDSARNILGKLFNYLDANPQAVNILKTKPRKSATKSSTLMQALDVLLEDI